MATLSKIAPITVASVLSIAAATTLFSPWTGTKANAQQTSLCYQRCTSQYGWPEQQCASYCRRSDSQTRVYGYTRRVGGESGYSGGCGTYRYWNGDMCVDARDKAPR